MRSTDCYDLDHASAGFHSGGTEPGYDNVVISRYFNQYFPAAAQLGQQLRNRPGGTERLAFLTHSWLVSLFLNCPARIGITCPNSTTVDQFRAAVHHGDIVWHALPHNAQVWLLAYHSRAACCAHFKHFCRGQRRTESVLPLHCASPCCW
jgi:hypothetical protein